MSMTAAAPSVGTLYDVPVSNNGARCRMVLYYKSVDSTEVAIVSPAELGGLKSEAYLQANPQGKMPLLALSETKFPIPESDTICRYLCARFADRGPALMPTDVMLATRSDRICRLHDIYLGAVQSAMYKAAGSGGSQAFPPFGPFGDREAALCELMSQLKVLEEYADTDGPFLVGAEPTLADCTIWPSAIFWAHMLPKFASVDAAAIFGPRISRWMRHMATTEIGARVQREIAGALVDWDAKDRWASIRGAGVRDSAAPTIFDSILAGVSARCWPLCS
jgi:glutathione S-transferase